MDLFAYLIAFLKRKDINRTRKKNEKDRYDFIKKKKKRKEKRVYANLASCFDLFIHIQKNLESITMIFSFYYMEIKQIQENETKTNTALWVIFKYTIN